MKIAFLRLTLTYSQNVTINKFEKDEIMTKKVMKYLPLLSFVCGILVFLMMFFPAIVSGDEMILRGTEATIGTEITSLFDLGSVSVGFNFWNFMAFLFPLVVVFTGFQVSRTKTTELEAKINKLGVATFSLIAFILSLFVFLNFGESTKGVITGIVEVEYNFGWFDLGIGVILGAIFAGIGILSSGINLFFLIRKHYL